MEMPIVPKPVTLKKYGLNEDQWLEIYRKQGEVCYICQKLPKSARLNVDHFHCKGYKKLPADEKRRWIRGLLCYWCNKCLVGRGITIEKSKRVTQYLEEFEARKPKGK